MNPVLTLQRKLRDVQAALAALEHAHGWLKGNGTGWRPEHYGIAPEIWDAAQSQHFTLRKQMIILLGAIERRKAAPGRGHLPSTVVGR